MSAAERELFRLLINTVSGIGPKIALNILSGMNPTAFRGAVANGDVQALSQISGVGKKTAERIVVELKDKIGAAGAWEEIGKEAGRGRGGISGGAGSLKKKKKEYKFKNVSCRVTKLVSTCFFEEILCLQYNWVIRVWNIHNYRASLLSQQTVANSYRRTVC